MSISARNISWALGCVTALTSCSDTGTKYQSTENLERPPAIELNVGGSPAQAPVDPDATSESIKKGLNDQVHLDKSPGASALVINKPFEQAWFILGVLLKQLELEITDRNREAGYYYVKYDPDLDYAKRQGFWDGMMAMFGDDDYAERVYSLKLTEIYGETEVTAGFAPESSDKLEGEKKKQQDDAKTDGPDRLLQTLYQTLRDGMAEQSMRKRRE